MLLDEDGDVVALRRGAVVVACNAGRRPVAVAAAAGLDAVLTTGEPADGNVVPADTTVWFTR